MWLFHLEPRGPVWIERATSSQSPLWFHYRWHEGDRPPHGPAVCWRPGGLRVPLHPVHRLPRGTGGGRCRRQEHQHLLQLEGSPGTLPPGLIQSRPADFLLLLETEFQTKNTRQSSFYQFGTDEVKQNGFGTWY